MNFSSFFSLVFCVLQGMRGPHRDSPSSFEQSSLQERPVATQSRNRSGTWGGQIRSVCRVWCLYSLIVVIFSEVMSEQMNHALDGS